MQQLIWIIMALIAGALLPIQAGLNTKMGKIIASPINASLISFIVGGIAVLFVSVLTKQQLSLASLKTAPGYVWLAGLMGAFYVTTIILAFPRIGPALTFGLVVAGQMIISVLLDQYNILVAQQHQVNIWKIAGIVLVVSGVVIIRKF